MPQIQISSKQAVKDINDIINSFNRMRKSITGVGDGSKASYRKMSTGLKALKKDQVAFLTDLEKLQKIYKNTAKSQKSFVTQLRNTKKELKLTNVALDKANAKLLKFQKTAKKGGVFGKMTNSLKQLLAVFGILSAVNIFQNAVKSAFKLTKTLDSLAFSMKAVITDSKELGQTEVWLQKITEDYGAEIVTVTNRYIKFRAAANKLDSPLQKHKEFLER